MKFENLLQSNRLIPVVNIADEAQALGLAGALLAGGINVIEVTLRSDYAITALSTIKQEYPEMVVIAGTVNSLSDFARVHKAGVDGVISPGFTHELAEYATTNQILYMPGVSTASEILAALSAGFSELKLFPASVAGGINALKAFAGPFAEVKFCPTGGIGADNYQDYLALDNVMCVGGSWIASSKHIAQHDWSTITRNCLALQAA